MRSPKVVTILELEHVGKRYRHGSRVALEDVSLVIEVGEMVVVWGERRSGRSTLLRVAAGIEPADTGVVRLEERELAAGGGGMLRGGVGYCRKTFRVSAGADGARSSDRVLLRASGATRGGGARKLAGPSPGGCRGVCVAAGERVEQG